MARILIRNAHVITLDEQGDLPCADILVDGDRIAAIWARKATDFAPDSGAAHGQSVGADGHFGFENPSVDEVVDAQGCIAIPGLVNAHMHTWQTALRGVAANWTLLEYFKNMHAGLATVFQPEDLHIATWVGALNQLNCGTTTLADWCHNNKTPAHNDAAIDGLLQSGIRAAFFHGTPKPDPKPWETPFWEQPHPRSELERLLHAHEGKPLLSVHAAVLGPHYSVMDVALHDFRMAKELGVVASMHQGGGPARTPDGWQRLEQEGLLGPHINIVHGHALSDEQLQRFCGLGMSFSAAAESEMSQGHGHPITGRLLALGKAPSLGVDLESNCSGDMLTQARIALGIQRSLDNVEHRTRHGGIPATSTVRTRQALEWVTVEGARMLGQLDRIGTLKAGKQADLVLIRASDLNMQPVHDAVNSVVFQTSIGNITDVLVAGRWKKRSGQLVDDNGQALNLAPLLDRLGASGRKIVQALAL
jgi:cytosine/adenosine deaminase-related metal-dependent hydrolase